MRAVHLLPNRPDVALVPSPSTRAIPHRYLIVTGGRGQPLSVIAPPVLLAPLSRLRVRLGGRARLNAIILLGGVLALNTADLASLGAIASRLKPALELDNTQLGVLAAAPSFIAALTTLPMGALADRASRVRWLTIAVAAWAVAMIFAGACATFGQLLIVRLVLGAATAAAGPFVASLVGDLFWPAERGRIYGYILAGELIGAGFGLIVAGNIAGLSWRAGLWVLALPSIAVAIGLSKGLAEPARGGAGRLPHAVPRRAREPYTGEQPLTNGDGSPPDHPQRSATVERAVKEANAPAQAELVLDRDPMRMSLWRAARYVLKVRTNVVLVIASALGYFFQAGVNTFGVVFVIASFRVSQPAATWLLAAVALGALGGTVLGGRLADALLARGHAPARMIVAGGAFMVASCLFVPGLLTHNLLLAMPIYIAAAVALGAPNAPIDAARLDVIPSRLWGRAEAVRTVLRTLAIAAAPLLFGVLSDQLSRGTLAATKGFGYHASAPGLRYSFLMMLVPMAAGGLLLLLNAARYTRDVATAIASDAKLGRSPTAHVHASG